MDKPIDLNSPDWHDGYITGVAETLRERSVIKPNSVRFFLPFIPVSINSIYEIWFSQRQVKLKVECLSWKTRAKEFMPPFKLESPDSFICVDTLFYYDFYYKNGNLKKVDTQNLMKLLIDAVAERYGFKDERVKRCPIDSQHSKEQRVAVTVSEYWLNDGQLEIRKEKPSEL